MSHTIWKATLKEPSGILDLPEGAEILCAHEQFEEICLWFRCSPQAPKRSRAFAVVGTGHPAPEDGEYIGTAFLQGGGLVFHVFVWPVEPAPH